MNLAKAATLALYLGYLLPIAIGAFIGHLTFTNCRSMMQGKKPIWVRLTSCIASALVSAITGIVAAFLICNWVDSFPRGTSDTGTAFGILFIGLMLVVHSALIGAIAGTGIFRSGVSNTDNH